MAPRTIITAIRFYRPLSASGGKYPFSYDFLTVRRTICHNDRTQGVLHLEGNVIDGRYMETPTLVIEMLPPSTRRWDMVDKLNTFMLSGVKEYWIVDPKNRRVMVYNFKHHDILDSTTHAIEDSFASRALSGLHVVVADIFAG